MSVAVYCISEENNQQGPEIGDSGALGIPSLEIAKEYDESIDADGYTFGWLYSGLESIGLVTKQMADFFEFLESNKNHTIHMIIEGSGNPNEEKIDWENLAEFTPTEKVHYKKCRYVLEDQNTGNNFEYECEADSEGLIPIEKVLTEKEKANFVEKIINEEETEEWFANQIGLLDPDGDFYELKEFINENIENEIKLSIQEI